MLQIFDPNLWSTDICKTQISTLNLNFTLKTVSLSNAILSFFSRHGPYFHPTKDRCSTSPSSPFFTFVVILVIFAALKSSIFFSGKFGTLGTQKEQKIWIVVFLDEKPRVTFANFLHLFIQGSPLTNSALHCWVSLMGTMSYACQF